MIDNSCPELSEEDLNVMSGNKLTKGEKDFYLLSKLGFTPSELCVVFDYQNLNSVYVKESRINGKLRGSLHPALVPGMVFAGIFVFFLMIFCYETGVMEHIDKFFEKLNFDPWINEMIKSLTLVK